jgi:photosystem II stability/assembly factor-like uncharacterized protein
MAKSKKEITIILTIILYQSMVYCQWIQSSVINKGFITTIAVKDSMIFSGGRNLSDSTVSYFYSKDCGTSWNERFNSRASHPNAIIITDNYIFTGEGSEGGYIFRTSDLGLNWEVCFEKGIGVTSMAFSENILYAGTISDFPTGVWKSTDEGNNWTEVWPAVYEFSIRSLVAVDSFVIAGTSNAGIYGSSDYGETWEELNNGFPSNSRVNGMILFNNEIFAEADSSRIYYTTDFGLNWQPLNDGLESSYIQGFAASNDKLFAATDSKVYVLLQQEKKWKDITADLPALYNWALATCGNNLLLGTGENGLWYRSIPGITGVEKEIVNLKAFSLSQNYPNPFNPLTIINYTLPVDEIVLIKVYDVLGKKIAELVNEFKTAGEYSVQFDGSNLSSGVYFYSIVAGSNRQIKKMLLTK